MQTINPEGELIYVDEDGCFVHEHGDGLLISHVEDLEPGFETNHLARKELANGFDPNDEGHSMRLLGSVPLMTMIRNPELVNDKHLKKYLNEHPRCRVVPAHTF